MTVQPVSADLLIKLGIAAAVLGLIVYAAKSASGAAGALATQVADMASTVADTVGTIPQKTIEAAGAAVGIPKTDTSACAQALADGRTLDASLYCPAGTFLTQSGIANPSSPNNIINQGATAIGNAVISPTGPGRNADGSMTWGGWLYDMNPFEPHPDPTK